MMLKRVMGKASFARCRTPPLVPGGRIQVYVRREDVGDDVYEAFQALGPGRHRGRRRRRVQDQDGRTPSMPCQQDSPADQESAPHARQVPRRGGSVKYRQRYVDLMTDEAARKRFVARSRAVSGIREFMVQHGFLEVETPCCTPSPAVPTPSLSSPTTTRSTRRCTCALRRAYLKRLVVGGFDRVFEINRNFRNEGISVRHNPEFTMMEFYAAYWNYQDLMSFTEDLVRDAARRLATACC